MTAKYVVGIDLGTTNSVVAYAPLDRDKLEIELLGVPQLVDSHTVEVRASLASFCFLAPENQSGGSLDLPWVSQRRYCVGEFARRLAAEAPERTVSAAKSWLSHGRVDRRAGILPWQAPADVETISPVVASQRYLEHLVQAWHAAFSDAKLNEQRVVLTVPASFDAVARELTREAALAAGLPQDLTLVEEPQAAVYAWLASQGDAWRQTLRVGDQLLVCDVGGGTTDFTLVQVGEHQGEFVLERRAVGNHLLVGGDNMDLALAHFVADEFAQKGVKLDPWQSVSLWHSCRAAKERLLADDGPDTHTISVLGRSSKLIGGTVSVQVDRDQVIRLLVDGFFPYCEAQDRPVSRRSSGFQQIGLPYESDPAITKHLAAFLSSHDASDVDRFPTHLMYNGGVFQSQALRERLLSALDGLRAEPGSTKPLAATDLDFAVARGAASYGWTKELGGIRIRGGVARSYYVGIETAGLAIPGAPRPLQAICVVPFGMEEGTETDVPAAEIGLVHGEEAEFRFFSSSVRPDDRPGDRLRHWEPGELTETASLQTTLSADDTVAEPYVPVQFHTRITELGQLELWCVSTQSDRRWKLEFNVRESAED